jgi:hypothetical protein
MMRVDRSPSEWFAEAVRCYVERHQGCPWCGGSHRVYQVQRDGRHEFFCNGCDFRTGFDQASNEFFAIPGEDQHSRSPDTMYEI